MKTKNVVALTGTVVFLAALNVQAYFDPSIGRWASRDPIGEQGGQNVYAFVGNNGVSRIDPFGLATLRFEVVTGLPVGYSGTWSQPFWAGSGDYGISDLSAWSQVSLNNEASFYDIFHTSVDYCNTVQIWGSIGTKGDAGDIKVYATDNCGGTFHISGLYSATMSGSGPNPGYGFAVLTVGSSTVSSITASAGSPIVNALAPISTDVTLAPKKEQLVVEYRPTLALKNRDLFGGVPAYVSAFGWVSMDTPVKIK
jgi:hypothetical protein